MVVAVGLGGWVCVREILKKRKAGGCGWGGQPPSYALRAESEFQATQEDGGDDVKDDRRSGALSFFGRTYTQTTESTGIVFYGRTSFL